MASPTPYKVSTITCNGTLGVTIDAPVFFKNVQLQESDAECGVIWVEYLKQSRGWFPKKRKEKKNFFDNQVTVLFKMGTGYFPNCKLFQNGSVQLTGIRSEEDGRVCIEKIGDVIRSLADVPGLLGPSQTAADVHPRNFIIRMINSDFGFRFSIRRKNLHKLLISDTYGNSCSFQPMGYPGVKLQYFWNESNSRSDGVCRCSKMCFGKGKGLVDNDCKKVTVAIFESGNVLITGGNSLRQVDEAYRFITNVVASHRQDLEKTVIA